MMAFSVCTRSTPPEVMLRFGFVYTPSSHLRAISTSTQQCSIHVTEISSVLLWVIRSL